MSCETVPAEFARFVLVLVGGRVIDVAAARLLAEVGPHEHRRS